MTNGTQVRFDELVQGDGIFTAAWGISAPWAHPVWDEYLLFLYDIRQGKGETEPIIHKPGMTYEFVLHAIDPSIKIDFNKNLFDQPTLSPLHPANIGYQFEAADDQAAVAKLKTIVELIEKGQMSPDTDFARMWHPHFADGFDLLNRGHGDPLP